VADRCFAINKEFPRAAKLAEEYVSICSNDLRAWRILGGTHFATQSWAKAVWAYTNAVMLGGEDCYAPLLVCFYIGYHSGISFHECAKRLVGVPRRVFVERLPVVHNCRPFIIKHRPEAKGDMLL
jgi:hypothetical protein